MQNTCPMDLLKPIEQRIEDLPDLLHAQGAVLEEQILKVLALDMLHHEIGRSVGLPEIMDGDDVGMFEADEHFTFFAELREAVLVVFDISS